MSKLKIASNNIIFEIISKSFYNERNFIKMKSVNKKLEAKIFYIFSSKTTFGLWKQYINDDVEQSETLVSTLLNFELQKFIFNNFKNIPIDINIKNEIKKYNNTNISAFLNDDNRRKNLLNHQLDDYSELIYSDIDIFINTTSEYIEAENNEEDEINDNTKIMYIKQLRNSLIKEFKEKFIILSVDLEFTYRTELDDKINLNCKIYKLILRNNNTNYICYKITYDYINNINNLNDISFLITFLDKTECNEYGLYNYYYDNLYNKLVHFIYDDECFLNNKIIDNFRIDPESNILYVGEYNNFFIQ